MTFVSILKKTSDLIDSIVMKIVFTAIVTMLVTITLQVVCRVFFDALTWSEELSRYLLVWSSFFGATLAYKRGLHISVSFLLDILPGKLRKITVVLGIILSIVFFSVCVYYGFKLIALQQFQVSAAMRLPMRYVYWGIPVSFAIMIIHGVSGVLEELFKGKEANI